MAIPLIFGAVILFAAAYQNQLSYLMKQLGQDVGGYFTWLVALMAIAAIGLIPKAKPIATSLLVLVILVLFLKNQGIYSNIQNIRGSIVAPPAAGTVSAPDVAPAAGEGVKQTGTPVQQSSATSSGASSGGTNILGGQSSGFGNIFGGKLNKLFGF